MPVYDQDVRIGYDLQYQAIRDLRAAKDEYLSFGYRRGDDSALPDPDTVARIDRAISRLRVEIRALKA